MSQDAEMTTTCEPCALRKQGQLERAEKIDGIRQQRLILSALNGSNVSRAEIMTEVAGCTDCVIHMAGQLIGYNAGALVRIMGSVENAKQGLNLSLIEDVNDLPPDDGPGV